MEKILLLATRNAGKQREMQALLAGSGWKVLSLADVEPVPDVEEDGNTFLENAFKKAVAVSRHTGRMALADDSGLEVSALGGWPGVRSARYARGPGSTDEENVHRVLEEMCAIPDENRNARFVCAAVVASENRILFQTEQSVEGYITRRPDGSEGFGYDPIFYFPAFKKTFAAIPPPVKNTISHRGKAMREVTEFLNNYSD